MPNTFKFIFNRLTVKISHRYGICLLILWTTIIPNFAVAQDTQDHILASCMGYFLTEPNGSQTDAKRIVQAIAGFQRTLVAMRPQDPDIVENRRIDAIEEAAEMKQAFLGHSRETLLRAYVLEGAPKIDAALSSAEAQIELLNQSIVERELQEGFWTSRRVGRLLTAPGALALGLLTYQAWNQPEEFRIFIDTLATLGLYTLYLNSDKTSADLIRALLNPDRRATVIRQGKEWVALRTIHDFIRLAAHNNLMGTFSSFQFEEELPTPLLNTLLLALAKENWTQDTALKERLLQQVGHASRNRGAEIEDGVGIVSTRVGFYVDNRTHVPTLIVVSTLFDDGTSHSNRRKKRKKKAPDPETFEARSKGWLTPGEPILPVGAR